MPKEGRCCSCQPETIVSLQGGFGPPPPLTRAVAGRPGHGCSLASAPETFSIPQFHRPGLGGAISSLVSQMKEAF